MRGPMRTDPSPGQERPQLGDLRVLGGREDMVIMSQQFNARVVPRKTASLAQRGRFGHLSSFGATSASGSAEGCSEKSFASQAHPRQVSLFFGP